MGYYTAAYNSVSVLLWSGVLYYSCNDLDIAYKMAIVAQVFNLLDIIHAGIGVTKSSVLPAVMQAASRLLSLGFSPGNTSTPKMLMLMSWSVADAVRFGYYLQPDMMKWPRYSLFIILYPVGFLCELITIYYARVQMAIKWSLLLMWPAGFYVMYSHMFKQRSKQMKKTV